MKTNTIFRNVAAASALLLAGMTSCTDWYDHYEGNVDAAEESTTDAWTTISADPQLSEFAEVLQKQGFANILSGSETYTIFAPENGSFKASDLINKTAEQIQNEFILNHIASGSYVFSGDSQKKIYMMNQKNMTVSGNGQYKVNGLTVTRPNIAIANGVIHVVKGNIPYFENIYETLISGREGYDSIADYYKKYHSRVLNLSKSVPGDIKDGQQHYLDSVFDEHNNLFSEYRQYINEEDSNYTMIIPSNVAWEKSRKSLRKYFQFPSEYNTITEIPERARGKSDKQITDLLNQDETKIVKYTLDSEHFSDSLVNEHLCAGLCFNNNFNYNRPLENYAEGTSMNADSLVSTAYSYFYAEDASNLMTGMTKEEKSNGAVLLCSDTLRIPSWSMDRSPLYRFEAEYSYAQSQFAYFTAAKPKTETITNLNINPYLPPVTTRFYNGSFVTVEPETDNGNPTFVLPLRMKESNNDVICRSGTKYNVYVTVIPNNINVNDSLTEALPCRFQAFIGYNDKDGKLTETTLKNGSKSSFESEAGKVSEVLLGSIEFPVIPKMPYLRLAGYASETKYDHTLRIDNIILIPEELDNYIQENPHYKYQYCK